MTFATCRNFSQFPLKVSDMNSPRHFRFFFPLVAQGTVGDRGLEFSNTPIHSSTHFQFSVFVQFQFFSEQRQKNCV